MYPFHFKALGFLFVFSLILGTSASGQLLSVESQTETFTDYVLSNPRLVPSYRYELTVPFSSGRETWRVLEQEIVRVPVPEEDREKITQIVSDVPGNAAVIFASNPGEYRKQMVATLQIHVTRLSEANPDEMLITQKIRFRVYHEPVWETTALEKAQAAIQSEGSPLATGTWYKIPVTRDGIHQIDRTYLQNLGINVASIDPRNIQLWGTDGYMLPQLNSAQRSEFSQIPIIVNGESDGSFDASDVILFYGNSPNRYRYDANTQAYSHETHTYSSSNYVFLTVGTERGVRLAETGGNLTSSRTITQFRDFLWKEEDLRRPDNRTNSGRNWLGQQFPAEGTARTQVIFRDTIPGYIPGTTIDIDVVFAARSTRSSRFTVRNGNTQIGTAELGVIPNLNSSSARAAMVSRMMRTIQSPVLTGDIFEISATYENSGSDAFGWLDWIRVWVTRELRPKNNMLHYFTPNDGNSSEIGQFVLRGFSNRPTVMDVTNPTNPILLAVNTSGNDFTVNHTTQPGRRIVAQTQFLRPVAGARVNNQNLRGISTYPNYIIVTSEDLFDEAVRFANYRRENGEWEPVVALQSQIFNEFSGGVPDVTAIRDYVKFLYDRAGIVEERIPQHLLLFGDTTFDYKGLLADGRLTNHVFTFQSEESHDRTSSYASDDFFVLLGNNEGVWAPTNNIVATFERIDMGVGRLPVQTRSEARIVTEKIKIYENPDTFGDWRTTFTFTSDNETNGSSFDGDLHVWNSDGTAETIDRDASGVRLNKIYQISYPIVNTPTGRLAIEANQAFVNSINNGTLVVNFSGHGSEQLLTAERLFQSSDISRLNNLDKLTIFVTATCDFGRFDDPYDQSGAEKLVLWRSGGSVAAFTTTRIVYTSASTEAYNFGLNIQLTRQMTTRGDDGLPQSLGDIYRKTKNTEVGATFNSRKFILIGDPAMRIGLPQQQVAINGINDMNPVESSETLTVRALDQATVTGFVRNTDGSINTGFNGQANIMVYDAERFVRIPFFPNRPNYVCSLPGCQYRVQNDLIFNGQVTVVNGEFSSRFIVPNDIAYSDNKGRVLVYAKGQGTDGVGSFSNIIFNGRNPDAVNDNTGPDIQIFLNDLSFTEGSLVNNSPKLIVVLEDQSGINTAGSGVGHELMAYLTKRPGSGVEETIILNNFYRSELDDFTRGRVEYPLDNLEEGSYTLRIRAWDVFNNVSERETVFEVATPEELSIRNVYNYPNPMSGYTRFVFEHNQAGQEIDVLIRVYTLSGRPVARISREGLIQSGNISQFEWHGRDDDGNVVAAGTYIYHVQVRGQFNGKTTTSEKTERLVIVR